MLIGLILKKIGNLKSEDLELIGCICCSVAKSLLTLCDPVDCSTPGSPSFTISRSLLKLRS